MRISTMCLALPGQIETQDGFYATVKIGPVRKKILNPIDARTGEWVLIENGIASEKLSADESAVMAVAWNQTTRKKKSAKKRNDYA